MITDRQLLAKVEVNEGLTVDELSGIKNLQNRRNTFTESGERSSASILKTRE